MDYAYSFQELKVKFIFGAPQELIEKNDNEAILWLQGIAFPHVEADMLYRTLIQQSLLENSPSFSEIEKELKITTLYQNEIREKLIECKINITSKIDSKKLSYIKNFLIKIIKNLSYDIFLSINDISILNIDFLHQIFQNLEYEGKNKSAILISNKTNKPISKALSLSSQKPLGNSAQYKFFKIKFFLFNDKNKILKEGLCAVVIACLLKDLKKYIKEASNKASYINLGKLAEKLHTTSSNVNNVINAIKKYYPKQSRIEFLQNLEEFNYDNNHQPTFSLVFKGEMIKLEEFEQVVLKKNVSSLTQTSQAKNSFTNNNKFNQITFHPIDNNKNNHKILYTLEEAIVIMAVIIYPPLLRLPLSAMLHSIVTQEMIEKILEKHDLNLPGKMYVFATQMKNIESYFYAVNTNYPFSFEAYCAEYFIESIKKFAQRLIEEKNKLLEEGDIDFIKTCITVNVKRNPNCEVDDIIKELQSNQWYHFYAWKPDAFKTTIQIELDAIKKTMESTVLNSEDQDQYPCLLASEQNRTINENHHFFLSSP